jgi:hypothetical protein
MRENPAHTRTTGAGPAHHGDMSDGRVIARRQRMRVCIAVVDSSRARLFTLSRSVDVEGVHDAGPAADPVRQPPHARRDPQGRRRPSCHPDRRGFRATSSASRRRSSAISWCPTGYCRRARARCRRRDVAVASRRPRFAWPWNNRCIPDDREIVARLRSRLGGSTVEAQSRTCAYDFAPLVIAIFLACAWAFFGTASVRTPSLRSLLACSRSAPSGSVKLRQKLP